MTAPPAGLLPLQAEAVKQRRQKAGHDDEADRQRKAHPVCKRRRGGRQPPHGDARRRAQDPAVYVDRQRVAAPVRQRLDAHAVARVADPGQKPVDDARRAEPGVPLEHARHERTAHDGAHQRNQLAAAEFFPEREQADDHDEHGRGIHQRTRRREAAQLDGAVVAEGKKERRQHAEAEKQPQIPQSDAKEPRILHKRPQRKQHRAPARADDQHPGGRQTERGEIARKNPDHTPETPGQQDRGVVLLHRYLPPSRRTFYIRPEKMSTGASVRRTENPLRQKNGCRSAIAS